MIIQQGSEQRGPRGTLPRGARAAPGPVPPVGGQQPVGGTVAALIVLIIITITFVTAAVAVVVDAAAVAATVIVAATANCRRRGHGTSKRSQSLRFERFLTFLAQGPEARTTNVKNRSKSVEFEFEF